MALDAQVREKREAQKRELALEAAAAASLSSAESVVLQQAAAGSHARLARDQAIDAYRRQQEVG